MSGLKTSLEQLELEALELELEAAELAAFEPRGDRLRVQVDEQSEEEAEAADIEPGDGLTGDPELDALGAAAESALAEAMAELEAEDEAVESEREAAGEEEEPPPRSDEPLSATLDDLVDLGDADGLVELARALRLGIRGKKRDLAQCYQALSAAAELGSAEAAFRSALFHLSGVVVPEDVGEGLSRLRSAAKAGSTRARLYLANVYELGIGREPAPDKAGVWYRGVARAQDIEVDEDDPEYVRAMAELGSIRHVRIVLKDEEIPKRDRLECLRRAKPLGYALLQRNRKLDEAQRRSIELEVEQVMEEAKKEAEQKAAEEQAAEEETTEKGETTSEKDEPKKKPDPNAIPMSERLMAFVLAMFAVGAGIGVGVGLTTYAQPQIAAGEALPVVGPYHQLIVPLAVLASLIPAALFYSWRTLALAVVGAGALAFGGSVIWKQPAGALFADRLMQAQVFGVVGLIVLLFLLGLAGGTRKRRWKDGAR
jgi:hypothetical protein